MNLPYLRPVARLVVVLVLIAAPALSYLDINFSLRK